MKTLEILKFRGKKLSKIHYMSKKVNEITKSQKNRTLQEINQGNMT